MIKTLQRKFVVTAMIAITVLLLFLIGVINVLNYMQVHEQSSHTLSLLTSNDGMFPKPNSDRPMEPPKSFLTPPFDEDTALSTRYFIVRTDPQNQIRFVDVEHIASVTEDDAAEYASTALSAGQEEGKVDHFQYRIISSQAGPGKTLVFLDCSDQFYSIFRVLTISALAALLCWALMLLLVLLLSKKAIRPVAVSLEKQKQFVTNAGHEIKTPLAIIMSNTDAMELHQGPTKWSHNIRTQTARLNGLMQNLLLLAKMDEASVKLTFADFNLSLLVQETISPYMEPAAMRSITLESIVSPDICIHSNRDHMAQLISILMDNAVKYTDAGGHIVVFLKNADKRVSLRIKNTCDHLPDISPDRLFDRFYRGDAARTQKNGGYGIGLSMAKAIVEALGGSISAKYEEDNIIAFTVKLGG
ncbi:HAMP domain-containing histidine kinase [[Clostridium] leptum]|nr:HAMP domain-containing histidine kinase [[Clostridium] leptum]